MMESVVKIVPTVDVGVTEQTLACGCVWIVRNLSNHGRFRSQVRSMKLHDGEPIKCDIHKKEEMDEATKTKKQFEHSRKIAEELKCDSCGKHIAYVSAFDLQGSDFFCNSCKNQ